MPKAERAPIHPHYIVADGMGQITGSLGKAGLEQAAALFVRVLQLRGAKTWEPITTKQCAHLMGGDGREMDEYVKVWTKSPFWRPDLRGIVEQGFIEGWVEGEPDAEGRFTEKFHDALYKRFGWKAEIIADQERAKTEQAEPA